MLSRLVIQGPEDPGFGTPKSEMTDSDEVFNLALQWLKKCKCAEHAPDKNWYPTRLLDIRPLKQDLQPDRKPDRKRDRKRDQASTMEAKPSLSKQDSSLDKTTISLVAKKNWKGGKPGSLRNDRYVTLSHCWGPPQHHGPKLTSKNIADFEAGIEIRKLPKTFRDAIRFAARLPQVGFIWIDSLCIKQGEEEDWLTESALMNQVYSKSHLNISATAAGDSEGGLYFGRSPENLLEDEISLNIDGIPVPWDQVVDVDARDKSTQATQSRPTSPGNLRRCVILDTSFWTQRVDWAPVNRRAWVLQERLLCPRVLHFCRDQVAWECAEFDAAEARPLGIPNYQLTGEGLLQESQFKGLDPDRNGRALRAGRLRGLPDPVAHLQPQIHAFELWKRVVEVYSRTELTVARDKLIALSGIARMMPSRIGSKEKPATYVAGLWRPHLESQLLWKVEPVYNPHDETFEHYGRRPLDYRAPTFSWAAIDVEQGNGITYGEVTDKEIYISIEEASVKPKSKDDLFGMVEESCLTVWGRLRPITLTKKEKGRFCWTIKDDKDLVEEKHTNIYLDSVQDTQFDTDEFYCLPTAKGGYLGTGDSTYIFCLLLRVKKKEDAVFERIGFTKLSSWADKKTWNQIGQDVSRDVDFAHPDNGLPGGWQRFYLE
ncbi:hypothetical protein PFICI_09736 [Pestalotiopsis fici W106-1]|uniref:Heterokaryon incompatibility domain-containing protein n=1 Tax=Pestalotiopsis fici (strain W106-1 / CGMCC3.15140) TaxID=1229662 RepID=W3WV27_PESFW|nr:uncharacterized protein PFICI_09736 [Pestalotiopsis fici W106-1]ETS77674.1 hypothetical protein PFICI_09736 [Pestalotiopsis fici W106-1]